jgi:transposase
MERPMQKLNDLSRSLTPFEPDGTLIAVIEMSLMSWLIAGIVPGVERQPLKKLGIDEGASLKLLHRWREEVDIRQAGDAMPLKAAMQRRPAQLRDGGLQRIETIIKRQERVSAEGDDNRLFLDRQHRGLRLFRAGRQIGHRAALLPLGDSLLIDTVALGQAPQALLTMLYRSTDRLCRCGAAVENLAHSASLQPEENNAPSKPGIKHLACAQRSTARAV